MSCYNWERGTIVIPAKAYPKFRRDMIEAWNKLQMQHFERAKTLVERIRQAAKGSRTLGWYAIRAEQIDKMNLTSAEYWAVTDAVKPASGRPKLPLKKDFAVKPVSRGCTLAASDFDVTFNDNTHSVHWSVSENNHAVEAADEHPYAGILFRALRALTWTRGSGGTIVGNDEYNQDSDYEGGGGNYVTREFGPEIQKREKERANRSAQAGHRW